MSGTNNPNPGWYPAPDQPGSERYWDGGQWTDQYRPVGGVPPAPPAGAPGWQPQGGVPGQPQYAASYQQGAGPAPDNYLVWAILSTLFCCLPLGIVSIVKSSQVNGLWAQGRAAEAQAAADSAKQWAWIAAGIGIVVSIIYIAVIASVETSSTGF